MNQAPGQSGRSCRAHPQRDLSLWLLRGGATAKIPTPPSAAVTTVCTHHVYKILLLPTYSTIFAARRRLQTAEAELTETAVDLGPQPHARNLPLV